MTVFEWQAKVVDHSARYLAHFVETTSADRLNWAPSIDSSTDTRSVFELVFECCRVNRRFATLLKGQTPIPSDPNAEHNYRTAKSAIEDLMSSAAELVETIMGLSEDALEKTYTTGMGPVSGMFLLDLPVANMNYHAGQINLIQLLYGDPEFHIPPDFTTF